MSQIVWVGGTPEHPQVTIEGYSARDVLRIWAAVQSVYGPVPKALELPATWPGETPFDAGVIHVQPGTGSPAKGGDLD